MTTYVDRKREPERVERVVSDAVVDSKGGDNDVGDNTGGREDIRLYQLAGLVSTRKRQE